MNDSDHLAPVETISQKLAASVIVKLIVIGGLMVTLMLPIMLIMNLIFEREARRDEVIAEIGGKWGLPQKLSGPFLSIPYEQTGPGPAQKPISTLRTLHLLPESLNITGPLDPETRYRGIYAVIVYTAKVTVNGLFRLPDGVRPPGGLPGSFHWDNLTLSLGVQDLRGIKEPLTIKWGDIAVGVEPGHDLGKAIENGVNASVSWRPETQGTKIPFSFTVDLKGSDTFRVLPAGKITTLSLNSTWDAPSFTGEFLPENRTVSGQGFAATWKIFHFNRNIPQSWWDRSDPLPDASVGIQLLLPLNEYQKNERPAKYAILIIVLTFAAFFVTEGAGKQRVHPVQYLLIGLSLLIFYPLLLSLSEQIGFDWAHLVSAVATTGLITWYASTAFSHRKYTLVIGTVLAALYGYLYFILQLEDYALLAGSVGLFVIMALIMAFTRRIDWYADRKETS